MTRTSFTSGTPEWYRIDLQRSATRGLSSEAATRHRPRPRTFIRSLAPLGLVSPLLLACNLLFEGGEFEGCDWQNEVDLSPFVAGELGGEWHEVPPDDSPYYTSYRLFFSSDNRPRIFHAYRQDIVEDGLPSLSGYLEVAFGCELAFSAPLAVNDPVRTVIDDPFGGGVESVVLSDVTPLSDGNGYILTHNTTRSPAFVSDIDQQDFTYFRQVDESTIEFERRWNGDFDGVRIFTRVSDVFPTELADALGLPEDKNP